MKLGNLPQGYDALLFSTRWFSSLLGLNASATASVITSGTGSFILLYAESHRHIGDLRCHVSLITDMTLAVTEASSPNKPNLDMTLAVAEASSPNKPNLDMTLAVAEALSPNKPNLRYDPGCSRGVKL